jgi:hypothetical protein
LTETKTCVDCKQTLSLDNYRLYNRNNGKCSRDHVKNDGSAERKNLGQFKIYRGALGKLDTSRYQVLCANCNLAKFWGRNGECPHKTPEFANRFYRPGYRVSPLTGAKTIAA